MSALKILIAPNAFKHSLSAVEVADAIKEGLVQSGLLAEYDIVPVADGGDGTLTALNLVLRGTEQVSQVADPLGRVVEARWGISEKTAIIEMAEASGIHLLQPDELDPLQTNTFGTGQLITKALDQGASEILIGIGGSATVDGATGMLRALGVHFIDGSGQQVSEGNPLMNCREIDISRLDKRLKGVTIKVLCDVDNPLLGPNGAATVFGPQKGANKTSVEQLENAMQRYAGLMVQASGKDCREVKGGGAAGGLGFALHCLLDAEIVSGSDFIMQQADLGRKIKEANIVITGEGKLDSQSVSGKAPFKVAQLCRTHQTPCYALAGAVEYSTALQDVFTAILSVVPGPVDLESALAHAHDNIKNTACQLGHVWQHLVS